jgi:iron complex outermembrane recepter protein
MSKHLLLMTCASSALALMASIGHAATATAAAAAGSAAATTDTTNVTELVVTAEKREQSLQKVPVAVSVFTGSQRDTIGINSVQDVTNFAPGFTYDPGNVHAYIRGVGRQSINLTDDSRVASYEDSFYVYSPYELDKSSLFLTQEQIERGPQNVGGKNASGGSIDMISVRPTDQPYGEIRAAVGNYGTYNIEGAVSGQVAPGVDVRIAAYDHNQDQGYYNNLANGISEGNVIHEWYVEPQIEWKPNDQTDIWIRGFAAGWDNRGDAGSRTGYSNGSFDETNLTDANTYPGAGLFVNPNFGYAGVPGSTAAAGASNIIANPLAGEPGQPATINYLPSSVTFARPGINNNPSLTNPNNFSSILPRTVGLAAYNGFNTIFTYDLTPDVQVKYIGGYQQYDYTLNYSEPDTDVTSFTLPLLTGTGVGLTGAGPLVVNPLVDLLYKEDDQWFSHELSFQSTSDSPLQWTAGAYYYQQHYTNPITATAPEQPQIAHPFEPGAGGAPNLLDPAPGNPNNDLFLNTYDFTYQDEAVYGELSYKFNDQFKITGNVRYTDDEKFGTEEDRDIFFGSSIIDGFAPLLGAATPAEDVTLAETCPTGIGVAGVSASCFSGPLAKGVTSIGKVGPGGFITRGLGGTSSAVTGGAGIEWTPTPDIFTYARYSRGYEALSFAAGGVLANPEVSPEFINSYEVGYKETFGHNLLIDLAGFYYDYNNLQVPLSITTGDVVTNDFINVAKAESTGFEAEAYWTPVKDLLITGSYSFDYTAIETGCSGSVSAAGVLTPASGALCVQDTNDPAAVAPGAKPVHGQIFNALTNAAIFQSVKGDPLPDAPENKLALDVAYTFHFAPGDFTVSGAYVYRGTQDGTIFNRFYDNAPSWDDFDLRALWKGPGDKYEIIGYVKNIFDTLQYEVANEGVGLLGNARTATTAANGLIGSNIFTLAPPRTVGLEVRYKFF